MIGHLAKLARAKHAATLIPRGSDRAVVDCDSDRVTSQPQPRPVKARDPLRRTIVADGREFEVVWDGTMKTLGDLR